MPLKSKSQMRYLFANEPEVAKEFASKTKNIKALPEKVKKAMLIPFCKIAKDLFNPAVAPMVPYRVTQQKAIQTEKERKMQGLSAVEYRNELTSRRTGIIQRNKKQPKAI